MTGALSGTLSGPESPGACHALRLRSGEALRTVHTNARGEFRVDGLEPGIWEAFYLGKGESAFATGEVYLGEATVVAGGTTYRDLAVVPGCSLSGNFTLAEEGFGLKVVVRRRWSEAPLATGHAVNSASPRLRELTPHQVQELALSGDEARRVAPGYFEFSGLPPDDYLVEVSPDWVKPAPGCRPIVFEVSLYQDVTLGPRHYEFSDFFAAGTVVQVSEREVE